MEKDESKKLNTKKLNQLVTLGNNIGKILNFIQKGQGILQKIF